MTALLVAELLGPAYLLVGVGLLLNRAHYSALVKNFSQEGAATYLSGIAVLAVGLAIVNNLHVWTLSLEGLVTLIGWIAVVKGALLLLLPRQLFTISKSLVDNTVLMVCAAVVALLLGGYLTYAAYLV